LIVIPPTLLVWRIIRHLEIAKLLLNLGADVKKDNLVSMTAASGHLKIVKIPLIYEKPQRGARVEQTLPQL
jgi:hypothetical protein